MAKLKANHLNTYLPCFLVTCEHVHVVNVEKAELNHAMDSTLSMLLGIMVYITTDAIDVIGFKYVSCNIHVHVLLKHNHNINICR